MLRILGKILQNKKIVWALVAITLFFYLYTKDIYTVTAYCGCRKCINSRRFRDKRFASNQEVYFGGIAASKAIPFGTELELTPLSRRDRDAMDRYLKGRRVFTVEDRGFLIKGKRLDIFIPQSMGGHKTALKWGKRKMRVKKKIPLPLGL